MSWPVTDEFRAAIASRQTDPIFRLDVLDNGIVIGSSEVAQVGVDLQVRGGGVDISGRAGVRRSGSADLVDTTGVLEALTAGSLLDPVAPKREFRLWRGLRLASGDELVPLGTFGLETASVEHSREAVSVSITGRDRAARVSEGGWLAPYTASDGFKAIRTAVKDAVFFRIGTVPFFSEAFTGTDDVPKATFGGDAKNDPWTDIENMATGAGGQVLFDPMGGLVLRHIVDHTTLAPAWTHRSDGTGLLAFPARRSIDRKTLVNGVTVRSSATWLLFPIEATAWDTDPLSRTYAGIFPDGTEDFGNPGIGRFPVVIEDAVIGTQGQAEASAAALLPGRLGIEELIDMNTVPMPFLDADDVLDVTTLVLGEEATRLSIDSTRIPLDRKTAQTVTARQRRR